MKKIVVKKSAGILTQRCNDLITVAGQCRTYTELSPLPLVAAPHQNRFDVQTVPHFVLPHSHSLERYTKDTQLNIYRTPPDVEPYD
mgnify:CR=1 FL=1